ncbi:hypothetical protein ABT061_15605 [Streptosporangium sp. NPDC002544]|uniref:hypothetical protein n=1 Tax=Streptosporangium sp. NPDC002544 TaxID=3154538 RepID=UPI0033269280
MIHEQVYDIAANIGIQEVTARPDVRDSVDTEIEHGATVGLGEPLPPREEPLAHAAELGRERLLKETIIHEYGDISLYGMNYYWLHARNNFARQKTIRNFSGHSRHRHDIVVELNVQSVAQHNVLSARAATE